MSMLNLVRLPLIFISGVFIPLSSLPGWGQAVAFFSPLTYTSDLIRFGYNGASHISPFLDILVLAAFIIALPGLRELPLPEVQRVKGRRE